VNHKVQTRHFLFRAARSQARHPDLCPRHCLHSREAPWNSGVASTGQLCGNWWGWFTRRDPKSIVAWSAAPRQFNTSSWAAQSFHFENPHTTLST